MTLNDDYTSNFFIKNMLQEKQPIYKIRLNYPRGPLLAKQATYWMAREKKKLAFLSSQYGM